MHYSVSHELKQHIVSKVIEQTPFLRKLSMFSKRVFPITVACVVLTAGIRLLHPGLDVVLVAGTPQKDIASIIGCSILWLVLGRLGSLCSSLFLANRVSIGLTDRTDEKLDYVPGCGFLYTFHTKYHSSPDTRIIIKLSATYISQVKYDTATGKLVFHGVVGCFLAEHYDPNKDYPWGTNLSNFVLYDYFEPSLLKESEEQYFTVIPAQN